MAGINAYAASAGGNSFKKMTVLMSSGVILVWGERGFLHKSSEHQKNVLPLVLTVFVFTSRDRTVWILCLDVLRRWDPHGFKCHFMASKGKKKMAARLIFIVRDTVLFMAHYTEWGAGEFSQFPRGFKSKKGHISVSLPPHCKTSRRRIQTEVIKIKATWRII